MTDSNATELKTLSKLKLAGKLRYWRGTIEMPEAELHAICDEIQAEHEQAIAATLGTGECEQVFTDCEDGLMPPFTAHCSKCGTEWGFTPKFCPECGAAVTLDGLDPPVACAVCGRSVKL